MTIRAMFTAIVISCTVPTSLRAGPSFFGDMLDFPLLAQSGPGDIVWRNPASLARAAGTRGWARGVLPHSGEDFAFRSIGVSMPLGHGLPVFCSSSIPAVARATGIDSALAAALVAAESGFNPRAVSVTGARGLTQLTSRTARSLGVYNRHWPQWNLWGGLTYLAQMRRLFGDDELALAAYNVGPGAVQRKGRAVLQEPAVASYVATIFRLRKAYATRYPTRCTHGGNGIAVAFADSAGQSAGVMGWGIDVQSFLEFGAGWAMWQAKDSTVSNPLIGTRIYLLDPLIVAGTYHPADGAWELGVLLALQGERVLLGCERDREAEVVAGMKVGLPLNIWVEAKARRRTAAVGATIETHHFTAGFSHVASVSKHRGAETLRQSLFVSFGRAPAL
ncbi:transglycosylase SLT domain-containing protein [Candidatus Fermentibacteria bacterium]|nr:transglycosylase SLT domain-containing protein [Candidatus Fermentibacteria bacterium]